MNGPRRIVGSLLMMATLASAVSAGSLSFAADEPVGTLRWKAGAVRIAVSASLLRESSNIKRDSDVAGALRRSLDTWSGVADVEFQLVNSDKLNVSPSGPSGDGVSLITIAQTPENVLLFSKDSENAAATTRVFYNRRGLITEADIVLNPYEQFSTDGTLGTFDLESTLTHEIGHLLGLRHSLVLGSSMHSNYGRNGVFGLRSFSSRTLSADDIAAVRAIYGVRDEATECCGSIEGKIAAGRVNGRPQVWIEDTDGRVQGSVEVGSDGSYVFAGLDSGRYRLFAQGSGKQKTGASAELIGEAVVISGQTTIANGKVSGAQVREIDLTHVGLNGQLSDIAIQLNPGRVYTVYLGGRNLDPRRLNVLFSTSYLAMVPGSGRTLDYGDEISVISFDVRVQRNARKGDYSIYLESPTGGKRALIGGLTIENSPDISVGLVGFDD
ncbi:MAG TPA: matrixin family metalloprotease [Pyrinomonadaceae bacterium]|nr:matrixin family metalloprotease [Pyrinomonadaceae bacterium]